MQCRPRSRDSLRHLPAGWPQRPLEVLQGGRRTSPLAGQGPRANDWSHGGPGVLPCASSPKPPGHCAVRLPSTGETLLALILPPAAERPWGPGSRGLSSMRSAPPRGATTARACCCLPRCELPYGSWRWHGPVMRARSCVALPSGTDHTAVVPAVPAPLPHLPRELPLRVLRGSCRACVSNYVLGPSPARGVPRPGRSMATGPFPWGAPRAVWRSSALQLRGTPDQRP